MQTEWFYTVLAGSWLRCGAIVMWLAVLLYWVHRSDEYSAPVTGLPYSLREHGLREIRLCAVIQTTRG